MSALVPDGGLQRWATGFLRWSPSTWAAARLLVAALATAGAASVASIASVGVTASAAATAADVPPAAPLATTWTTPQGSWALVAMGRLGHPKNTFWEMFYRPSGGSAWSLVTPTGVADNGGLVAAEAGTGPLTAGFEPSQYLKYSPVAQTTSDGRRWSPGILPDALLAAPDALAAEPGGGVLALVRAANGSLLRSDGGLSSWRPVVRLGSLAGTGPGRACGLVALRAVTVADGTPELGGACTKAGVVGVYTLADRSWVLSGPRLPGGAGSESTTVLRLAGGPGGTSGLVEAGRGSAATLFAMWRADPSARWSLSPPLQLDGRLVATGFGRSAGLVEMSERADGSLRAEYVAGTGSRWVALPDPPARSAAVVAGPDDASGGDTFDALAVDGSHLTDWRLEGIGGAWVRTRTLAVPIQYGSST